METQAALCVPGEGGEMLCWSSSQAATKTQKYVAKVLGVPAAKVVCKVKRMGGGFGGKETRSVPLALAVAVAAAKLNRPVRLMLDRDEDMCTSGQRHPFYAKCKVGAAADGKLEALDVQVRVAPAHVMAAPCAQRKPLSRPLCVAVE